MMKVAEQPLNCDEYAQTHEPISDAEYDAKVVKLRELMSEVHLGSHVRPRRCFSVEPASGGFGSMANLHMHGAEAGSGLDRTRTKIREQRDD
jgi:hypothetical protein